MAKGVAMFLVFFGHLGTQWFPALSGVLAAIYTFHMPLFFVASGFFFHARSSFGELAKRRARQLLVPYYVFSVLALAKPVAQLVSPSLYQNGGAGLDGVVGSIVTIVLAQGNSGLWFLWSVFVAQLALWCVVRLTRGNTPALLAVLLVFVVGDYAFQGVVWRGMLPFQLGKLFEATAYVGFGHLVGKTFDLHSWQDAGTLIRRVAVMVVATILFLTLNWLQTSNGLVQSVLPLDWLVMFCTTCSAIVAVLMLCTVLPQWGWLQTVGRDSLVFYGVNDLMLKVVKFALFSLAGVSAVNWPLAAQLVGGLGVVVAAMLLSAVVNAVVQRHARWAIGDFGRDFR